MTAADISVETNDFDTLGGRLSRAREATDSTLAQVATRIGVQKKTLEGWECDRAAPRSNRLAMLAGILGVSPTWLLYGRGTSPMEDNPDFSAQSMEVQLDQLKSQREKISIKIQVMEATLREDEMKTSA